MYMSCYNEHINHKIIFYQDKLIIIKNIRNKMNEFKDIINELKINIERIINKYKTLIENMNIIYKINNNILKKYEKNKNKNYKLIMNLNNMNEYIEKEIYNIEEEYDYGYNINKMLDITEIIYKVNKEKKI